MGRNLVLRVTMGLAAAGLGTASVARAEVRVSALVGDHMVVERGQPVRLSGTAAPGEPVRASMAGRRRGDPGGRRRAVGDRAAGAPGRAGRSCSTIEGRRTGSAFADVWAGEVWVASGQSNMELPLSRSTGAAEATPADAPACGCSRSRRSTAAAPQDRRGAAPGRSATPRPPLRSRPWRIHFGRSCIARSASRRPHSRVVGRHARPRPGRRARRW